MSKEYNRYQEGLIKSLLARPKEIANIVDHVDSKDFENVNLKLVYEAILELHLAKLPISLPDIALKIGELGGAVDTSWIFNLDNNIAQWVQAAPPSTWAKLLKRESAKFKGRMILQEGVAEINDKHKNPLDSMDAIADRLVQVSLDAVSDEAFSIGDAVDEFERETKEIMASGGKVTSINSAYPTIDYYTQGWGATHLITIGARTGVGKSVFAINNAVAAMAQGKSVLFFSLEMTRREVISRIIASLSLIPIQSIEKAAPLNSDEIQRQKDALEQIRNSKLKIDTNPEVSIEYIKRAAIKQAQTKDGLDMIIVDYLQLITNEGKRSRQEEVADISRSLKVLAKELNIPVMVLVQLNRERRGDEEDKTPKIYDIRESGAVAQDSNVVILIDRNMGEDDEVIDPKATFIIAKNRQGEANKFISVRTRLECSLFIDENQKGQDLLRNLELAVGEEGDYEINYESNTYLNNPNALEDLSGIENDLANLFDEDDSDFF